MNETFKKKYCPALVSPIPRRSGQLPSTTSKKNPFTELPPIKTPGHQEEDLVVKELRLILTKPSITLPPIQKSTPSPNNFHKPDQHPSRQKLNPVINDEIFITLNSLLSTCESWTDQIRV